MEEPVPAVQDREKCLPSSREEIQGESEKRAREKDTCISERAHVSLIITTGWARRDGGWGDNRILPKDWRI